MLLGRRAINISIHMVRGRSGARMVEAAVGQTICKTTVQRSQKRKHSHSVLLRQAPIVRAPLVAVPLFLGLLDRQPLSHNVEGKANYVHDHSHCFCPSISTNLNMRVFESVSFSSLSLLLVLSIPVALYQTT